MNSKYIYGSSENQGFLTELRNELLNFGKRFPSPEGSSYYLGDDGTPWTDRNRETWITSRMTHVYSIGSMLKDFSPESSEEFKFLAAQGLKGLCGELQDREHGGWYAGITAQGDYLPNKQCYAHAFVILAASSALLAGVAGAEELLNKALEIYDRYFWNDVLGLACDTWSTDFDKCDSYRGLNANMHTVEAFLAVADATGNEEYRKRAGRIISHVISWAENNDYRIPEHFTEDWTPDLECNFDKKDDPFKPYGATPGHGIEWARLIAQWASGTAEVLKYGDSSSADGQEKKSDADGSEKMPDADCPEKMPDADCQEKKSDADGPEKMPDADGPEKKSDADDPEKKSDADYYFEISEKLYNRAISDAWNADGAPGIVYTTDWNGQPVVHDRMHWTLAEAINTSSFLFRITKNQKYADDYAEFMKYLDETVHDRVNGSWFHQLDSSNRLLGTVWPGKSDLYHAFQATLIPYSDISISIATAVRNERL